MHTSTPYPRIHPTQIQAFVIYEESIPDSKEQVTALQTIIASLTNCHVLSQDNRAALVHKTTGYCSKLLKKPDQCRAICLCSHLHWQGGPQGGGAEGVGEALARTTVSATPEVCVCLGVCVGVCICASVNIRLLLVCLIIMQQHHTPAGK